MLRIIPGEPNQRAKYSLGYHLASRRYWRWSGAFPVAQYTYNDGGGPTQCSGRSVRVAGYRTRHRANHEHSAYRHNLRSVGRRCGRNTPVIVADTKSFSHEYPRIATDICEQFPHRPASLRCIRRTRYLHRAGARQRSSSPKSTVRVAIMSIRAAATFPGGTIIPVPMPTTYHICSEMDLPGIIIPTASSKASTLAATDGPR